MKGTMMAAGLAAMVCSGCLASHGRERDADRVDDPPVASQSGARDAEDAADRRAYEDSPGGQDGRPAPAGTVHTLPADPAHDPTTSNDGAVAADSGTQVWVGELRGIERPCDADPAQDAHHILLLLELDASGAIGAASVTVGEAMPPPPARDPSRYYPLDPTFDPLCPLASLMSGFEYPGHEPRLQDGRFEVTLFPRDFHASWCALQQSYPASPGVRWRIDSDYLCRPTDDIDSDFDWSTDDSGDPFRLCVDEYYRACDCDAESCWPQRALPHVLDLVVDGDVMQGRMVSGVMGTTEVRLRRAR